MLILKHRSIDRVAVAMRKWFYSKKECLMRTQTRVIGVLAMLMLCGMLPVMSGCKEDGAGVAKADETVALCADCGQIKGSDVCCAADAEACGACGLAKGAPGCCVMEKGDADVALCTHCGQIAGSDACCKPDQAKCDACGLDKGSPGCCKLPKA